MNKTVKRAIRISRANSEWFCTGKNRIHVTNPKEEIPVEEDPQNKSENK